MKEIWHTTIASNNVFRNEYIKTIKNWDINGDFIKRLQDSSFIAVFYNDLFLGAAIIDEKDGLDKKPSPINGSNQHYDEINQALLESHHNHKLVKKM